jgi:hypothetical protein
VPRQQYVTKLVREREPLPPRIACRLDDDPWPWMGQADRQPITRSWDRCLFDLGKLRCDISHIDRRRQVQARNERRGQPSLPGSGREPTGLFEPPLDCVYV